MVAIAWASRQHSGQIGQFGEIGPLVSQPGSKGPTEINHRARETADSMLMFKAELLEKYKEVCAHPGNPG